MLSERLAKIADFITPGNVLVDVGCDHAYLAIELVKNNICPNAIATDISRGPIRNAKANIKAQGLQDRIATKVSDGLNKIKMFEGDSLVIAGMGGNTILHILKEGDIIAKSFQEIIIEPQSEVQELREFLYDNDYYLIDEDMVCESGKYYPILKLATKKGLITKGIEEIKLHNTGLPIYDKGDLEKCDLIFGPYLIKTKNKILKAFLDKELIRMERIHDEFFLIDSDVNPSKMKNVDDYIYHINRALEKFNEL